MHRTLEPYTAQNPTMHRTLKLYRSLQACGRKHCFAHVTNIVNSWPCSVWSWHCQQPHRWTRTCAGPETSTSGTGNSADACRHLGPVSAHGNQIPSIGCTQLVALMWRFPAACRHALPWVLKEGSRAFACYAAGLEPCNVYFSFDIQGSKHERPGNRRSHTTGPWGLSPSGRPGWSKLRPVLAACRHALPWCARRAAMATARWHRRSMQPAWNLGTWP
jgi:hypothetical protein